MLILKDAGELEGMDELVEKAARARAQRRRSGTGPVNVLRIAKIRAVLGLVFVVLGVGVGVQTLAAPGSDEREVARAGLCRSC